MTQPFARFSVLVPFHSSISFSPTMQRKHLEIQPPSCNCKVEMSTPQMTADQEGTLSLTAMPKFFVIWHKYIFMSTPPGFVPFSKAHSLTNSQDILTNFSSFKNLNVHWCVPFMSLEAWLGKGKGGIPQNETERAGREYQVWGDAGSKAMHVLLLLLVTPLPFHRCDRCVTETT